VFEFESVYKARYEHNTSTSKLFDEKSG